MGAGSGRPNGRRWRRRIARVAVAGVVAAFGVLGTPGTASAYLTVQPLVDCVRNNSDGTLTFVLGYANNTSRVQSFPLGIANYQTPTRLQGTQPTTFRTGTVHGAASVTLQWWELGYGRALLSAPTCHDGTQLPAEGNGLGMTIVLAGCGAVAMSSTSLSRRRRRRAHSSE